VHSLRSLRALGIALWAGLLGALIALSTITDARAEAPGVPSAQSTPSVPWAVRHELNRDEAQLRRQLARLARLERLAPDSGVQVVRSSDELILRVPARWLFSPDSEQLRHGTQVQRLLALPVQLLRRRRRLTARVAVYSDNIGGATYNRNVSEERAEAVVKALEAAGIAATRLQPQGPGLIAAIASNDTPEGRMQNRRVEFIFERPISPPS
jgi:outer membrane protein OmpA-like peptidoglycan-associated protein